MPGKAGATGRRLLTLPPPAFGRPRKASSSRALRNPSPCRTPWRTPPSAQAGPRSLPRPRGLGGAGSGEPWPLSPSPSGESREPASASVTAHSHANASPSPSEQTAPQARPAFPRSPQTRPSLCFAFPGEATRHSEAKTTLPRTHGLSGDQAASAAHAAIFPAPVSPDLQ